MSIIKKAVGYLQCQLVVFALTLVVALSAQAQTAPSTNQTASSEEDPNVVKMSAFIYTSTQDQGYGTKSATPFKTRQEIVDIPQAITLVTRDLIDDIGEYDLAKMLVYTGGVPKFGGEIFQLRGSNAFSTYPVVDGLNSRTVYMDNLFIDTIEIIRGPAALLYPNSQLTGVVNKTTRRPQAKSMTSIKTSVTDYGLYRVVGDSTGAIGKVGEGQLNYRLLGGLSRGDGYFTNTKEDRTMLHPSLQWDHGKTSVLVAYDYQKITRPSNPTGLLQPNGKMFIAGGRENSVLLPPGASETHEHNGIRGIVVHSFSRDWESRFGIDVNRMHRTGSVVLPLAANWDLRTVNFFNRRNDLILENGSISLDTNGRYELGGMEHQSTFGFNRSIQQATNKLWTNTNFGGPGVTFNVRPIDNPSVNTLPVLPFGSYVQPANPGNRVRSEFSNYYFQQNVEAIKDRLILVGGYSIFEDVTSNIPNLALRPASTTVSVTAKLHRVGVVAQFFDKKLAIYAMKANTQLPPSPTAILQDGTTAPGASGDGREIGIKLSLFDGRLNTTVSVFDLETTGLAVFGGVLPDGRSFVVPLGFTRAKGFDGDITLSLSNNFELIGTFYSGDVTNQTGAPVDDSYTSTYSLVGKYSFRDGPAKGLAIGAGGYRTAGRVTSAAALTYAGKPTFITNKTDPVVKLFANYTLNKHWSFKFELENVFDGLSPLAINSATLMEANIGRSFTFHAEYKF